MEKGLDSPVIYENPAPAPKASSLPKFPRWVFALGLVFVLGVIFLYWQRGKSASLPKTADRNHGVKIQLTSEEDINLVPVKQGSDGVSPDSAFLLSSKTPIETNAIREGFHVFPGVNFKIKEKGNQSWEISFSQPLEKGKIYRFTLPSLIKEAQARELSWAFQIQAPLKITGSMPKDKAAQVPLNTSIEITFNSPSFQNAEQFFNISPPVEGRFEKHQNRLVFIPKEIKDKTIYTVTFKKGLALVGTDEKINEDYVFRFETGEEYERRTYPFVFSRILYEVNPQKTPVLSLDNWEVSRESTKAKLFRLGKDKFLECIKKKLEAPSWSYYAQQYTPCPVSESPVMEFEAAIGRASSYGQRYIEIPEALGKGFYLLEIENQNTSPSQALVESTSLSWYFWLGKNDSLFWVNNVEKREPANGATVLVNDKKTGQTDNQGIARVETPTALADRQNSLLTINHGEELAYGIINFTSYSSWSWSSFESKRNIQANDFWSYLYTDRELYQPKETLNFWGLIKPRFGNTNMAKITAKLVSGYVSWWSDEPEDQNSIIAEQEVNVSSVGTFTSKFNLESLPSGYYFLALYQDKNLISQKGFSVEQFQKPVFHISAKPEKVAIWAGEKNIVKVQAQYWDGTPLANTELVWNLSNQDLGNSIVTTDAAGETNIEIPTTYEKGNSHYWPEVYQINIHPANAEEAEINASTSFFAFGPAVSLEAEAKHENGLARVSVTARKIELDKLQQDPWDTRQGSPLPNQKIKIKAIRFWYEKIETGEVYDPIEKLVEKRYRYEEKEEPVSEAEITTGNDGKGSWEFSADPNQYYRVNLETVDERGRPEATMVYVGHAYDFSESSRFSLSPNKEKYRVGDEVKIDMKYGNDPVPTNLPNSYLVFGVQNGRVLSSSSQQADNWRFTFQKEFVPNLRAKAVWFTGDFYREALNQDAWWEGDGLSLSYDYEEKALIVNVSSEKAKYRPGEEATVKVKVADRNGQPQKANVMLSAVDEALSDLGGISQPAILSSLYRSVGSGRLFSYSSHVRPLQSGGAEGGGGGGEARQNFVNTALFVETQTGNNGEAELKYKLPDNITSWRLTAAAVTDDLSAGDTQYLLPVTKPLFVRAITAEEFLTSDQPKITVTSAGEILDENTTVQYILKAPSLGIKEKVLSEKAFHSVDFDLPLAATGNHKIELWAQAKGEKDGLVRLIKVIETRLVRMQTTYADLAGEYIPSWNSSRAVNIIVTNKSRSYWYPRLYSLLTLSRYRKNERADRLAAQIVAGQLLQKYFDEPVETNVTLNRNFAGGFSLIPYESPDLFLSAKISAIDPPNINKSQLRDYFESSLREEKSAEYASAALWGLAELQEPVLNTIQELSHQDNTLAGKIYLGLAATALGDNGTGRAIYKSVINQAGFETQPYTYIRDGDGKDAYITKTAIAMILAARLGEDAAESMWRYVEDNMSGENIFVLEKAIFLKSILDRIPADIGSFEYTLENKKYEQSLEGKSVFNILVTPEQKESFRLKPLKGRLGIIVRHWEKAGNDNQANPNLSLTVKAVPSTVIIGNQPALIEITATPTIGTDELDGSYFISLNLPSGLRYVDSPYRWDSNTRQEVYYSWPSQEEGNQLVFWYWRWLGSNSRPIRFLARPINKGQFIFEPAVVFHATAADLFNFSPVPDPITIQ